jgi:hypothetical protein
MSEPAELVPTVVLAPAGPALPGPVATGLGKAAPDQEVVDTVASVNALIRRWVPVPADGQPWPADTVQGATMLARRHYRRKDSPAGVETFGADGAAYVSRTDPDVAMLLQIGPYSPPVVG